MLKLASAAKLAVVGAAIIGVVSITNTARASADPIQTDNNTYQQTQQSGYGNHTGSNDPGYSNNGNNTWPSKQPDFPSFTSGNNPGSTQGINQGADGNTNAPGNSGSNGKPNQSWGLNQAQTQGPNQDNQGQNQTQNQTQYPTANWQQGQNNGNAYGNYQQYIGVTNTPPYPQQNKQQTDKEPCPDSNQNQQPPRDNHTDPCPQPVPQPCPKPLPKPCPQPQTHCQHQHKPCPPTTPPQGGKGGGPVTTPPTTPPTPTPIVLAPAAALTPVSTPVELTNTGLNIEVTTVIAFALLATAAYVCSRRVDTGK